MSTQQTADPYATLGVARGATTAQVRAAYRRLAKAYHPDLRKDAGAGERMRAINQAWDMLSDPSRRAQYETDAARAATGARNGHWGRNAYGYRPPPATAAKPAWATSAMGGAAAGARPRYETESDDAGGGPLRWGLLLLLLIPVVVLSAAILGRGILPFPLLGLLLIVLVTRLFGGER